MCKSMRSNKGPEIRPKYFCISRGDERDSASDLPSGLRDVASFRESYMRFAERVSTAS